jgi:purine-binding chemotaxis protein CheW
MSDRTTDGEADLVADDADEDAAQATKYLLITIDDDVYGIDIAHVVEIIELKRITEVPDMPSYVKGVINLRGRVIPVVDLRLRLGMAEREHDDRTCITIVKIQDSSVGLVVDRVAEVQDIRDGDIEPPPRYKTGSGKEPFISGLAKVGDGVRILMDVQKLVEDRELVAQ